MKVVLLAAFVALVPTSGFAETYQFTIKRTATPTR